jgi:hypothetical protein
MHCGSLLFSVFYSINSKIHKCILGMDNSQYINNVTFTGAPSSTSPSQITPGSSGVSFTQLNSSVTIPFPPQITPIVTEVSVPNSNTNVNQITVVITTPNGTVIVQQTSPSNTNIVDKFPLQPLPENSTLTITFQTDNGQPPQNVTISVIACYTPSTATTIVTTGTVPPAITGSTPTLTISSTTSGATQGTGETLFKIDI